MLKIKKVNYEGEKGGGGTNANASGLGPGPIDVDHAHHRLLRVADVV